MEIFVKRIRGNSANNNQLYLIADGPGYSGSMYEIIAEQMISALGERYSIYLMDHRGTGNSQFLQCSGNTTLSQQTEGSCKIDLQAQYPNSELSYFNTYAIANDYIKFINEQRSSEEDVVLLYGSGHGAFIINQILTINTTKINAVVMDSYMYPPIVDYDADADDTGNDFISHCNNFGTCIQKLQGISPDTIFSNIFNSFESLTCTTQLGIGRAELQTIFRNIAASRQLNCLLLPIATRYLRCNQLDLDYLNAGIRQFNSTFQLYFGNSSATGYSSVLNNQVILNDLFRVDTSINRQPNSQELTGESFLYYFSNYLPSFYSSLNSLWDPTWLTDSPIDPFSFASTSVPALILGGEFDMNTNSFYSALAGNFYNRQFQRFIELPFASHSVLFNSPTSSGTQCGFQFVVNFFNQNPTAFDPHAIGNLCISSLEPVDFSAASQQTSELSSTYFNNTDPWGIGRIPIGVNYVSSASSDYIPFLFSTNDLPDIPNLALSVIVVYDTFDTSDLRARGSFSRISPGILPPSAAFTPDGGVGSSSYLLPVLFNMLLGPLLILFIYC